jgi:hypothetical protein
MTTTIINNYNITNNYYNTYNIFKFEDFQTSIDYFQDDISSEIEIEYEIVYIKKPNKLKKLFKKIKSFFK